MSAHLGRVLGVQSHVVQGHVGADAFTFPLQALGLDVGCIYTCQFVDLFVHEGSQLERQQLSTILKHLNASSFLPPAANSGEDTERAYEPPFRYIVSGFVGKADLLDVTADWLSLLRAALGPRKAPLYVCDPVMGDCGKLCPSLPIENWGALVTAIDALHAAGPEVVIITSVEFSAPAAAQALNILAAAEKQIQQPNQQQGEHLFVVASRQQRPEQRCAPPEGSSTAAEGLKDDETPKERREVLYALAIPKAKGYIGGAGDLFTALFTGFFVKEQFHLGRALQKTVAAVQAVIADTTSRSPRPQTVDAVTAQAFLLNPPACCIRKPILLPQEARQQAAAAADGLNAVDPSGGSSVSAAPPAAPPSISRALMILALLLAVAVAATQDTDAAAAAPPLTTVSGDATSRDQRRTPCLEYTGTTPAASPDAAPRRRLARVANVACTNGEYLDGVGYEAATAAAANASTKAVPAAAPTEEVLLPCVADLSPCCCRLRGGSNTAISLQHSDGICQKCPAGSYSTVGSVGFLSCIQCPPGSWSNEGAPVCEACPPSMTDQRRLTTASAYQVRQGQLPFLQAASTKPSSSDASCVPCEEPLEWCIRTSAEEGGWWSWKSVCGDSAAKDSRGEHPFCEEVGKDSAKLEFRYACSRETYCTGTPEEPCADGTDGVFCGDCASGYSDTLLFPFYRGCLACGALQYGLPCGLFICVFVLTGVSLWWVRRAVLFEDASQLISTLRSISFFWQLMSNLPPLLHTVSSQQWLILGAFSLGFPLPQLVQCLDGRNSWASLAEKQVVVAGFLPLALLPFAIVLGLFLHALHQRDAAKHQEELDRQNIANDAYRNPLENTPEIVNTIVRERQRLLGPNAGKLFDLAASRTSEAAGAAAATSTAPAPASPAPAAALLPQEEADALSAEGAGGSTSLTARLRGVAASKADSSTGKWKRHLRFQDQAEHSLAKPLQFVETPLHEALPAPPAAAGGADVGAATFGRATQQQHPGIKVIQQAPQEVSVEEERETAVSVLSDDADVGPLFTDATPHGAQWKRRSWILGSWIVMHHLLTFSVSQHPLTAGWLVSGFNRRYFWWYLFQQMCVHLIQISISVSTTTSFTMANREGPSGFFAKALVPQLTSITQTIATINVILAYAALHLSLPIYIKERHMMASRATGCSLAVSLIAFCVAFYNGAFPEESWSSALGWIAVVARIVLTLLHFIAVLITTGIIRKLRHRFKVVRQVGDVFRSARGRLEAIRTQEQDETLEKEYKRERLKLLEAEREGKGDTFHRHWRLGLRNPRIGIHRLAALVCKGEGEEEESAQLLTRLMLLPIPRGEVKDTLLQTVKQVESTPRALAALLHLTLMETFPSMGRVEAFTILREHGFDPNEVSLHSADFGTWERLLRNEAQHSLLIACLRAALAGRPPCSLRQLSAACANEAVRIVLHCGLLDISDYVIEVARELPRDRFLAFGLDAEGRLIEGYDEEKEKGKRELTEKLKGILRTAGVPAPAPAQPAAGFAAGIELFDFAAAEPTAVLRKRRIERALELQKNFMSIFPSALPVFNPITGEEVHTLDPQLLSLQQEQQQRADRLRDSLAAFHILKLEILGLRVQALQRHVLVIVCTVEALVALPLPSVCRYHALCADSSGNVLLCIMQWQVPFKQREGEEGEENEPVYVVDLVRRHDGITFFFNGVQVGFIYKDIDATFTDIVTIGNSLHGGQPLGTVSDVKVLATALDSSSAAVRYYEVLGRTASKSLGDGFAAALEAAAGISSAASPDEKIELHQILNLSFVVADPRKQTRVLAVCAPEVYTAATYYLRLSTGELTRCPDTGAHGLKELSASTGYTLAVWIRTPLPATGSLHALFADDQWSVFSDGLAKEFHPSGLDLSQEADGWHLLHVVAAAKELTKAPPAATAEASRNDSGIMAFYLDGSPRGLIPRVCWAPVKYLGNNFSGRNAFGSFAHFRAYAKPFTPQQVYFDYTGRPPVAEGSLVCRVFEKRAF
ncbi:hypothetical protein cyc_02833 [Cyclospora cayetanensis]|uniref:pyridoxal kinase n=1 Tax=Cyclospora cayetanensis TaxID=88456 RepID=A0A1D3D1X9_9EIME|nr:hypothetical protein cyc_02833 [Cyclospora cayetanensis]